MIVVIIGLVFIKYALPKFQAVLDERAEKIEGGLQHAEAAQAEAAELRAEYEQQLADARTEAARIKEAARAEGGAIVTELKAKAAAEAARTVETAQRQIEAERQQAAVSYSRDARFGRVGRVLKGREVEEGHGSLLLRLGDRLFLRGSETAFGLPFFDLSACSWFSSRRRSASSRTSLT